MVLRVWSLKQGIQFHYLASWTGCIFRPKVLKRVWRLVKGSKKYLFQTGAGFEGLGSTALPIKRPSSAPRKEVSTSSFPPSYRTFQVLAVKAFSLGYSVHQSCLLSTTGIPQPLDEGRFVLNFFKMQIEMFEIANLLKQWPCTFKVIFTKYICSTMAEKNMGFGKKIVCMRIFFL